MAPICADPRQIVIALDQQKRLELLRLVDNILLHMTNQVEAKPEELGSITPDTESDSEDHKQDGQKSGTSTPPVPDYADSTHKKPTKGNGNMFGGVMKNIKSVKVPIPWKNNNNAPSKTIKRAEEIQLSALQYLVAWQMEFMPKFEEIIRVKDTEDILKERKSRLDATDEIAKSLEGVDLSGEKQIAEVAVTEAELKDDIKALQALYKPTKTPLTALPEADRRECIGCILLLLLSTGKYSAHSRALAMYLASSLNISQTFLNQEESEIAKSLIESSTSEKAKKETMSAEAETAKRQQENKVSRYWKVGLASVAGATIIGVTGGLAAPLVAGAMGGILGGVGLGGVASFLGIFWMNGALVGALFGAYGAKMTGSMMDKYAKEVEDFKFIPLEEEPSGVASGKPEDQAHDGRRLRVTIGINGWLNDEKDIAKPWQALNTDTEVFALRYEMEALLALGTALKDLVSSFAWQAFKSEIIKRTVLATLWAALWPIQVVAIASNVDNPFNRASNRSKKAGRLLADALINKVQGERPVILIGYSLGAVAIHACLQSLAERQAFGLIDTVVIVGTPAPSDAAHWRTLRNVVSGKIFNVYSENDMVLGFAYRMHSLERGVAGLQAIQGVKGIENLDLSSQVSGHLRYPDLIGEILDQCGFVGVKSSHEIEKDDVIKMKDEYAKGNLVDLDENAPHEDYEEQGHRIMMVDNDVKETSAKSNRS